MDEAPETDFVESFWHIKVDGVNLAATQVCLRIRKSTKQFHFGSENWDLRATTSNKPSIQPTRQVDT